MQSTTIRISFSTHKLLKELAKNENIPMHSILEKALEKYRREYILHQTNAAFQALRSDQLMWNDELLERYKILNITDYIYAAIFCPLIKKI